MIPRLARIVGSFAIVVATYFAYTLVAVPFIEPPAPLRGQTLSSEQDRAAAARRAEVARKDLDYWFSKDDWELSSPWVIETASAKLLVQEYKILDDGRMEIRPCTMIFFPVDATSDPEGWRRRAVILQAPEGAILAFDGPIDRRLGRLGKLIGGELLGPFTIRSDQKLPGPQDDLLIHARDAKLTQKQITSPHPIDFRLGPNQGSGRDLVVDLLPGGQSDPHGPNIGGLKSFEISRDVELHLEFGEKDFLPTDSSLESVTAVKSQAPKNAGKPNPPVQVTCQGPFRFELDPHVATFRDRVDVLRLNPIGPSDTLNCELLAIHFSPVNGGGEGELPQTEPTNTSKSPAIPKLEPVRMEAYGNPVIVRAPSKQVEARGQALVYDMKARSAHLTGKPEVMLRQGTNEIRAPELHFEASEAGRWGAFSAVGPGWFEGAPPDDPSLRIFARWQEAAKLAPDGAEHLLSVLGQGHVEVRGMGHLDAPQIFLWLNEPPQQQPAPRSGAGREKDRVRLVPNRLLANGGVHFDSPQLFGDVDELQVWFRQFDLAAVTGVTAGLPTSANSGAGATAGSPSSATHVIGQADRNSFVINTRSARDQLPTIIQTAAYEPRVSPRRGTPRLTRRPQMPALGANADRSRRFHVEGRLLQASLMVAEKQSQLLTVNVSGAVKFDEMPIAGADEKPLKLRGEELHLDQSNPAAAEIVLTGPGAHVEARGLALDGTPMRLNRGTNLLTIGGAGRMTLPGSRNPLGGDRMPFGGTQNVAQPLSVDWRGRMEFDGYMARFYDNVSAQLDHRRMRTDVMEVTLNSRIDFSQPPRQPNADVEEIRCRKGVSLESETYEGRTLVSVERLQLIELAINQRTGEITGSGPGKLERVAIGSPEALAGSMNFGAPSARQGPPQQGDIRQVGARPPDVHEFNFLGVQFARDLTGNLHRHQIVLHERVAAIYGPVNSWQDRIESIAFDQPDATTQQGLYLTCSQLAVTQQNPAAGSLGAVGLVATGNTEVEGINLGGQHFLAQADRLSYDQSKDLLIFEGDARSPATLWRWEQVGGPRAEGRARKIFYWRNTGQAEVDDAQMFNLNLIGGGGTADSLPAREKRGAAGFPR